MTKKRNIGIDFLRLIAMYGVVNLHILSHGGVLSEISGGGRYLLTWFIEVLFSCAVNVYAIISGYVNFSGEEKAFKYSKYINSWLPVFVYSFGITCAVFFIKPGLVSGKQLLLSAFPVLSDVYWYFTMYTFVFMLIPWINKCMRNMMNKEATKLVGILLIVCSVVPVLAQNGNLFQLSGGYSALWLCVLYIVGAWIKKCCWLQKISTKWLVLASGICVVLTWLLRVTIPSEKIQSVVVSYLSPTIVIYAIVLVELFSRIKCNERITKWIAFWSPAAFGVYLIHEHPLIRDGFVRDGFTWITKQPTYFIPIFIMSSAFAIFAGCLIVERIRISLFKVLGINRGMERILKWTKNMIR